MRFGSGFALAVALALTGVPAAAQSLSVDQILAKLDGSWAHEARGVACGDGAVTIRVSGDQTSVTIRNWPAGGNQTFNARRVFTPQKRGQADTSGVLSLIDMTATPP